MNKEDIKNKLDCENISVEELSIKELKRLKNQAQTLTDKNKKKCIILMEKLKKEVQEKMEKKH